MWMTGSPERAKPPVMEHGRSIAAITQNFSLAQKRITGVEVIVMFGFAI